MWATAELMSTFEDFKLSKQLKYAIDDLGFEKPTPIQSESYSKILSGKDVLGISQTGTGKTLAFTLPLLNELKFSNQVPPRILILVPTRELVLQTVKNLEDYSKYVTLRVLGVYGGTNINTQKQYVAQGCDILVATPGRLRDLALSGVLQLKHAKKLVIDEVDVMLDLGFRHQLADIFDMLPEKRQNIMFSATMTAEVDELIDTFFVVPEKIAIAVSGTPLENIKQTSYELPNFHSKINLLKHLVKDKTEFKKVIVFVESKRYADLLFAEMGPRFEPEMAVIHSNKSQNYRERSIDDFNTGKKRIIIATDVIARGLDLDKVSHVINMDTPIYAENYMHRIGRTGRAKEMGSSILMTAPYEAEKKSAIEELMQMKVELLSVPDEVEMSEQLTSDERPKNYEINAGKYKNQELTGGGAFHEKKEKNQKENQGGSYRRKMAAKYKKPIRRGDKIQNMKSKKRKKR